MKDYACADGQMGKGSSPTVKTKSVHGVCAVH